MVEIKNYHNFFCIFVRHRRIVLEFFMIKYLIGVLELIELIDFIGIWTLF